MEEFILTLARVLLLVLSQFILALPIIVVFALVVIFSRYKGRRRRALSRLADQLGLRFHPNTNKRVARKFVFLQQLNGGYNRHAYNALVGTYRNHEVYAFDFHMETALHVLANETRDDLMDFTVFICKMDRSFPEVRIYPERANGLLGRLIRGEDIEFDSIEFSRAFTVKSNDRRFAYDVCCPPMMEFLLRFPWLALELEGNHLAIWSGKVLPVEEFEKWLNLLVALREQLPKHLLADGRYPEVTTDG